MNAADRYASRLAEHQQFAARYADKCLSRHGGDDVQAAYDVRRRAKTDGRLMTALAFVGAHVSVEAALRRTLGD